MRHLRFPILNAAFLQEVKESHTELWEGVALLERFCSEAYDPLSNDDLTLVSLGRLLQVMRDKLAVQFDLEETFGYLSDSKLVNEELHQQVSQALHGHRWLYLSLVELSEQVDDFEYRGTLRANLHDVVQEVRSFLSNLKAHEDLEAKLIRQALTSFATLD
ncbi:MAG: hypothetical protein U0905_02455 [Pirellulales bacterium]